MMPHARTDEIVHASGLWGTPRHEARKEQESEHEVKKPMNQPESHLLREGLQCEYCTYARSNVREVDTNLSIFGVTSRC